MKKKIIIRFIFLLIILIVAFVVYKERTRDATMKIFSCDKMSGIWYGGEGICEVNQLSKEECTTQGGVFDGCDSACRHDPKAEVCIMMCVQTCTFK